MKTFILSAGHNPEQKGAKWDGLYEYDVTSKWIPEIARYLRYKQRNVIEISTDTLTRKVEAVNEAALRDSKVIAVELHFNSSGNTYIAGNETLYYPGSLKGKAAAIEYNAKFMELAGKYVVNDRGVKEGYYQMNPNNDPDYWLKKTICPSLILEPAFLCQISDIGDNWKEVCWAIGDSLMRID